jgi:transcriptional regulator with XRE-family HTH domain
MGSKRRAQPRRLGEKLLQIRKALELTQEQMSEKLNLKESPVYPTHISEFERGKREPSLLVLLSYSKIAGVSTDVLIDDGQCLPEKLPGTPAEKRVRTGK